MALCDGQSFFLNDSVDVSECGRAILSLSLTALVLLFTCLGALSPFARFKWLPAPWTSIRTLEQDEKSEEEGIVLAEPPADWKKQAVVSLSGVAACFSVALAIIQIGRAVASVVASSFVSGAAWIFVLLHVLRNRLVTPPASLIAIAVIQLVDQLISLRHRPTWPMPLLLHVFGATSCSAVLVIFLSLPLNALEPSLRVAKAGDQPTEKQTSPEDGLSVWQWMSVSWIGVVLDISAARQLNFPDLWERSPFNQTRNLLPRFQATQGGSLLRRLVKVNARDITIELCGRLLGVFTKFAPPFLLNRVLTAFGSEDLAERRLIWSLALLTFLANLVNAELQLIAGWAARRVYERSRQTLVANAFAKALRRQLVTSAVVDEKDEASVDASSSDIGRILNIAQNDTWRICQLLWDDVVTSALAPIEIAIASVLLYSFLGWSAFAGVAVFVVATLITLPVARLMYKVDQRTQRATDKRISVVSEILQSIRLLKQLAWEDAFLDRAQAARSKELHYRAVGYGIDTFNSFLWNFVPYVMPLAAFWCLVKVQGRPLTVQVAFPSLALLDQIREPLDKLPHAVLRLIRVLISCRRVERFYAEPEREPVEQQDTSSNKDAPITADIGLRAGSFVYAGSQAKEAADGRTAFELKVPDLTFTSPSLTLIVGPTGSGKSSVLNALLGEMQATNGASVYRSHCGQHSLALAGQSAWLEQATIRDNICLAAPYDAARFQQVVFACALEPDLRELSHRDLTEIGERGVSLSGGQKARLALARALYSHADFVLLDDPLSAVDVDSARHIYEHCLKGPLLKDRCVIMTTHHEALCAPAATRTLRLDKGVVTIEERLVDIEESTTPPQKEMKSVEQLLGQALPPGMQPHKLIDEEYRETGAVKWNVYKLFVKSSGLWLWIVVALALCAEQSLDTLLRFLLKVWSEGGPRDGQGGPFEDYPQPEQNPDPWIWAWVAIFMVSRAVMTSRDILTFVGSYKASKVLFFASLHKTMRARMRWFDTTPLGRITNRLTGDVSITDSELSWALRGFFETTVAFLWSLAVVLWLVPAFAPVAALMFIAYWRFARGYRCAFRDIRRLERVAWSPMFSSFSNALDGLTHIRAFGLQQRYQDRMNTICDTAENMDRLKWIVIFWLRLRFDVLSALALFAVTILAYLTGVSQGFAAFGIVSASVFVTCLHMIIWSISNLEKDLAAVERLDELLTLDAEKLDGDDDTVDPPAQWPSKSGKGIQYDGLEFRYAVDLDLALKGISLHFGAQEKVAIVGRTGSGKSSLVNSLLRLVEPSSGKILIDGIDSSIVSLRDLRSRITTVPQTATLFAGTLRHNLDPLSQYTDAELCAVLERCRLSHWSLDDSIDASGSGASAGEKQLVALARAFLRKSSVIILDESTASVDLEMDRDLQQVIREELADCLVITIAHRIWTVIDYDRVVVLAKGEVAEQGSPAELLRKEGSAFRALCERSGAIESLQEAAKEAEERRDKSVKK